MYYIESFVQNGKILVTDTSDGVSEWITKTQLHEVLDSGVKVEGVDAELGYPIGKGRYISIVPHKPTSSEAKYALLMGVDFEFDFGELIGVDFKKAENGVLNINSSGAHQRDITLKFTSDLNVHWDKLFTWSDVLKFIKIDITDASDEVISEVVRAVRSDMTSSWLIHDIRADVEVVKNLIFTSAWMSGRPLLTDNTSLNKCFLKRYGNKLICTSSFSLSVGRLSSKEASCISQFRALDSYDKFLKIVRSRGMEDRDMFRTVTVSVGSKTSKLMLHIWRYFLYGGDSELVWRMFKAILGRILTKG